MKYSIRLKKFIKKNILLPLWTICDKYVFSKENEIVLNINFDPANPDQKRVLISYIPGVYGSHNFETFSKHTNHQEATVIVNEFIHRGYCVDIVHCQNKKLNEFFSGKSYDVIFGFGEPFSIACDLNDKAKKIAYLTENAPHFSLAAETERCEYYYKRHGKKLNVKRSGLYYRDDQIDKAIYGILIGNEEFTYKVYKSFFPHIDFHVIAPSAFYNEKMDITKVCKSSLHNFAWFGSSGAVHKGLDILLDVFVDIPDANLFIYGLSDDEKWLLKKYASSSNIINGGFLNIQSDDFLQMIECCTYVILPSASEGMATSVLTCMRHGMIPVVTSATGIELKNGGYLIEDFHVNKVADLIRQLMTMPVKETMDMKKKIYEYASSEFTIKQFKKRISKVLDDILTKKE